MHELVRTRWLAASGWRDAIRRKTTLSPASVGLLQLVRLLPGVSPPLTLAVTAWVLLSAPLPLGLTLATGALVGAVPDAVRTGPDSPAGQAALRALLVLAALFVAERLLGPVRATVAASLGREVDRHLEARVIRALNAPPGVAHLEDPAVLDTVAAARGVGGGANTPGNATIALANKLPLWLQALGYAVILGRFHWWIALGFFAVQVAMSEVRRREFLKTVKVTTDQSRVLRRAEYLRDLALSGAAAKEVRLYGLGDWLVGRFRDSWLQSIAPVWAEHRRSDGRIYATVVVLAVAQALILGALAWAAVRGTIDLTALTVFVGAVFGMGTIAVFGVDDLRLAWGTAGIPAVLALETLAAEPQEAAPSVESVPMHVTGETMALPAGAPREGIRFEDVTFRYPGAGVDAFAHLNLWIPAGESLAVVGLNGAGKTTLAKLLCRLYEPQHGRITVDGIDLRGVGAQAWQRRLAAIFQDFVQYKLPVRDNIGFGALARRADGEALAQAARRAGALEIVDALPQGWDTVLSREFEGGAELSGGQWQRVALARALFAVHGGARVLILDEPTANLDARAEAELYDRFLDITQGLTTVLISHRFSTVRRASRICVLRDGRVSEEGTHAELMAAGGRYAEMFIQQASRFSEEPVRA